MHVGDLNSQVQEILKGSFDLHVHAGPDAGYGLRLDALDAGRYAHEAEMAGFVLKSHHYPTASLAHTLNRIYPGLTVAGSIVLNREVGGLNPDALQAAANLGTRVVWMPTYSADFFLRSQGRPPGIRIVGDSGDLLPEVQEVMDIALRHEMVLASGHVSPSEALVLFREASARGIQRLIATHPKDTASAEDLRAMVSLGAYVEYTFLSCMPSFHETTPEEMVSAIRALGVERCVVTSDFGQWMNPPPSEGFRMAIASLLQAGMKAEEVSILVKANPLRLIGAEV